ncbi:MAG: T9SS type A sorting domain-containing protein, partial [Bacteroidota bacterium]
LNAYDMTLSACTEIIIEGDQEFIAEGNNQLILEINQDICSNNNKSNFFSDDVLANDTDTVLPLINTLKSNPNPFVDVLNININIAYPQDLIIDMTDIYGRTILYIKKEKIETGSYFYMINTTEMLPGFYILSSNINNSKQTIKIIKTDIIK